MDGERRPRPTPARLPRIRAHRPLFHNDLPIERLGRVEGLLKFLMVGDFLDAHELAGLTNREDREPSNTAWR